MFDQLAEISHNVCHTLYCNPFHCWQLSANNIKQAVRRTCVGSRTGVCFYFWILSYDDYEPELRSYLCGGWKPQGKPFLTVTPLHLPQTPRSLWNVTMETCIKSVACSSRHEKLNQHRWNSTHNIIAGCIWHTANIPGCIYNAFFSLFVTHFITH